MAQVHCGFVIKVRNLEKCRAFYRDLLRLGAPVTDSNFRTEFDLGNGTRLALCLAREEEQIASGVRSALWIIPDNPAELISDLTAGGYQMQCDPLNLLYPGVKCFQDPEANPIYLIGEA